MIVKSESILIYPYSYKTFPMVKLMLERDYNVKVATFNGLGLIGKDVSYSVNRRKTNIETLEYSESLLNELDILYIPNFNEDTTTKSILKDTIRKAIKLNKKIIVESNKEIIREFSDYENLIDLQTFKNQKIETYYNKVKIYEMKFYRPSIPVIFIGGIYDLLDNDYITIKLNDYLGKNGYKACCLSRQVSNKVFGCINFPDEFININNSIENRIISLNNYIKSCIEVLNPDLLIIQIPDGMLQYNDYYHNSFGNHAYLISQAVESDYFICSMTTELLSTKHYDKLSNYFSRKYDSPIDCAHYSNCYLDIPNHTKRRNQDVMFLNEGKIEELLIPYRDDSNYQMFNLFNGRNFKLMYQDIINKF